MSAGTGGANHAPLLENILTLNPVEQTAAPVRVAGVIPPYVRGTCLLNGAGRHVSGDFHYRHWLDGDGMLSALSIGSDAVRFTNRFVRSAKYVREQAEGKPVFRGFGTSFTGDRMGGRGIGLESPVNVSVYPFAGKLLAFGEQGLPYEIDPVTLDTIGLYTFDGQLNEVTPFSAHAKIDRGTGELFNFGVSFSAEHPTMNVYRFGSDGKLVYRRRWGLPYPSSTHDFAISERHIAFYISPFTLRMDALMRDGATLIDGLSWRPELHSRLMIASRETGALECSIDVGVGHVLHLVNAFEQGAHVVVDVVLFPQPLYPEYQVMPDLFSDSFQGHPVRFVVDVASATIVERRDLAYASSPDFPSHDPDLVGKQYDHFWMLGISHSGKPGRKFFDRLVRVDWSTGRTEEAVAPPLHYFGGEPMFIPDPTSPGSRGVVVCGQFDAERVATAFVMFDAFALAKGPIATMSLASPIQPQFHSTFRKAST